MGVRKKRLRSRIARLEQYAAAVEQQAEAWRDQLREPFTARVEIEQAADGRITWVVPTALVEIVCDGATGIHVRVQELRTTGLRAMTEVR